MQRKTQLQHKPYANREDTPAEAAVKCEWSEANELLQRVANEKEIELHEPELEGAIFCGHLVADLDSIAGAIAAAKLYNGIPVRASAINEETKFALEHWKVDEIQLVDDIITPQSRVCLVDFQQKTQLNPAIREEQIVGILDHHALQASTIVTEKPLYVDIRPWGSVSTMIAHSFVIHGKQLPKPIAGLLLSAILSDTLNLRSPTTTAWDKKMLALLVQYTQVDDVNLLCAQQFRAKSKNLQSLSAYQLVEGDLKQFKMISTSQSNTAENKIVQVAFAVIETTDSDAMLARTSEILPEMRVVRKELGIDLIFVAIVDIVSLQSHVLIAGSREHSLAKAANFFDTPLPNHTKSIVESDYHTNLAVLPSGQVSRKADFVPAISKAFANGWQLPSPACCDMHEDLAGLERNEIVIENSPLTGPRIIRRASCLSSTKKNGM